MTLAVTGLAALLFCVPHALNLERVPPALAAGIWGAALTLRALVAMALASVAVLYLPGVPGFGLISRICAEDILPFLTDTLPFNGHLFGGLALIGPALMLLFSVALVAAALALSSRAMRRTLRRHGVGGGPMRSLIVYDNTAFFAVFGVRRPRLLVSAGALMSFDDDELAAGLAHEQAHIARKHRYVVLAAELLRALARFLPGTHRATLELHFHLERDADEYALARHHEPHALASAIRKVGAPRHPMSLGQALPSGGVARRLRLLHPVATPAPRAARGPRALAGAMCVGAILSVATLPTSAAAGVHAAGHATPEHYC